MAVWLRLRLLFQRERDDDGLEAVWSLQTGGEKTGDGTSSTMSCMSGEGGEVFDAMSDGEVNREDGGKGTGCSRLGFEKVRHQCGRWDPGRKSQTRSIVALLS